MLTHDSRGAPAVSISFFLSHNTPEAASQTGNVIDENSVRPSYTQHDPKLN